LLKPSEMAPPTPFWALGAKAPPPPYGGFRSAGSFSDGLRSVLSNNSC
jgi:hypothetical protein